MKKDKPHVRVRALTALQKVSGGGIARCPGDCDKLTVVTTGREQLTIVF